MDSDFGPFKQLVEVAGFAVAAAMALVALFKKGAKWEPVEEDVPRAANRVSGLVMAVCLILLFARRSDIGVQGATIWCVALLACCVLSLTVYIVIVVRFVFDGGYVNESGGESFRKVIGGLWVTRETRDLLSGKGPGSPGGGRPRNEQEAFRGAAYEKDLVWPKIAVGLAQALFTLSYIAFVTTGTAALALSSLLLTAQS